MGIPVGCQIREVDNTHVGAESFDFLSVPEGECVVVAVGEDYAVLAYGSEIVHAEVAGRVAS